MQFPQYRKYANNKSYFEVFSNDHFRELKILGQRYEMIDIRAAIWPDKSYILDLLSNEAGHYEIIDRNEFYNALTNCETYMQPLH